MFVQCRGCNQTVPGSMASCQFCGTSLAGVAPQAKASIWHDDTALPTQSYGRPKWVPLAYNLVASYMALSGLIGAFTSFLTMRKGGDVAHIVGPIGIIFGAIWIALGIGLLLKVEFIRGVVNFFCGLGLVFGVIQLFTSIGALMLGISGVLMVANIILGIVTNAAMIYLVGETD